jgi:uncharacterized membrane protein YkvA (DUF1232 family)
MQDKAQTANAVPGPPFQDAAIKRIVAQLVRRSPSRRFLLADEVGLGKTHVAKGVIAGLRRRKGGRVFTVLYICSNTEIARQNETKLGPAVRQEVDRLTLITGDLRRLVHSARATREPLLFSLTPATSFDVAGGYGTVAERTLLYHLCRIAPGGVRALKSFWFRGTVSPQRWEELAGFRRKNRLAGVPRKLRSALAGSKEWRGAVRSLRDERPRGKHPRFTGRQIGALRFALSKAILKCIDPDLIICDEFQRFSRLLMEPQVTGKQERRKVKRARGQQVLEHLLKSSKCPSILLLSATPYPFYTPDADAGTHLRHFEAFYHVLRFLSRRSKDDRWMVALQQDFDEFGKRLKAVEEEDAKEVQEIRGIKARIERKLRSVMCRTERAFFVRDGQGAIDPRFTKTPAPQKDDIRDFKNVSRVIRLPETGPAQVVDFWKSAPACLAFTGAHYRFNKALRSRRRELHAALPHRQQIPGLLTRNAKLRSLAAQMFRRETGLHLWCRPTYQYWRDDLFGTADATKFLIFSHWKFVPTAVSAITSAHVARLLNIPHDVGAKHKPSIRFDSRGSLTVFDLCMPSLALAELSPSLLEAGTQGSVQLSFRHWTDRCRDNLLKHFQPGGRARVPLWRAIAEFEARSGNQANAAQRRPWVEALATFADQSRDASQRRAVRSYRRWLTERRPDDGSRTQISRRQFRRLVLILACSPALALLRAVDSAIPTPDDKSNLALLRTCLDGLRHQFTTRQATAIIKRAVPGRSFVERALAYSGRAHFQAVIDEYVYLVAAQHADDPEARTKVLSSVQRALQLGIGSPQVHLKHHKRKVGVPAHFAVAFGDDSVDEQPNGATGVHRKTQVREAFNSPFWPFVLTTTSVGQEGLDFHQYCRDVVHWNLPANPVDLEQREGRVCRRNSLVVRRAIAQAYPRVLRDNGSVWDSVFGQAEKETEEYQDHRGLCPHWIYEHSGDDGAERNSLMVRRHVFCYEDSRDVAAYDRLRQDLALYRLAFGQPRQEDLIRSLRPKYADTLKNGAGRFLRQFMFDLTPFESDYAWKAALRRARVELAKESANQWCRRLAIRARSWMVKHGERLKTAPNIVAFGVDLAAEALIKYVEQASIEIHEPRQKALVQASATLLYVVNAYDDILDVYGPAGLIDDVERISRAYTILPLEPMHTRQ